MKINTKLSALCIAATLMSVAQATSAAPEVTASAEATQPDVASSAVAAPGSAKAAAPAASASAPRPSVSVAPAAAPTVPSTAQPSTSAPAAPAATSVKPSQLDKLNHESAIPLVLEAQSRYLYAISGGNTVGESFQRNGTSYRYLSEDIGTKSKLISYLTQAYTKQASEQFVSKFFVEINGKLAQLDADGGNLLAFNRATAKMVTMTPVKRSYLLTVPYPAETKKANEKITVNFEKVGSYWKISSAPHVIF